ncbi:MAG: iron-containing alcohol dehydrogenase [Anaerolineae bacterium]
MYTFQWPVRTYVGNGIVDEIGGLVPPDDDRRRAVITSAGDAWCQPLNRRVQERLVAAGYQTVEIFPRVEPNPSWDTVHRGADFCREHGVDVILAIGGGSTMDASKVIAMEAQVGDVVTVPTTAGTGSELNEWGVITETETRDKQSIQAVMPRVAIIDPELTLTLPPLVTLLTGVDAFCHALECYVGNLANPVTDALALMAMELTARWLRRAVEHGDDIAARKGMVEASMLGGGTMLGAGLGLMHGIGNIAGGLTHDPHGLILARLLDPVMDFNAPAIPEEKLERIAPFVETVRALTLEKFEALDVPQVEMQAADLPILAERAAVNVNSETNPRGYTTEDIIAIAREAFEIVE